MSSSALLVSAARVRAGRWLGIFVDACLGLAIVVIPGLAATRFEQGELYKQALLIGLVTAAVTAASVRAALLRRAEVAFGWLQMVLVVFGLVTLFSSFTSVHPYLSFLGEGGQRAWAWSSLAAFIAFALLLGQRTRSATQAYNSLFLVFVGGIGLAGGAIWSMVGREPTNAAGSVYALTIALAPLLVMGVVFMLQGMRTGVSVFTSPQGAGRVARASVWLVSFLTLGVLLAVNFWLAWVMVVIGIAVMVGCRFWFRHSPRPTFLWSLPVMVCALLALGLLALPAPWKLPFPGEVALSQRASWEIAQQGLAAHPLLGTGLGTWAYNQAAYRPQIINASPFWATSFDRGISVLLTLLVTTGMLGALVLAVFVAGLLVAAWRFLAHVRGPVLRGASQEEMGHVFLILFAGWVPTMVALAFYTSNFAHQLFFWTLTGCLLGLLVRRRFVFEAVRSSEATILMGKAVVMGIICLAIFVLGGQTLWAQIRLQHIVDRYQAGTLSIDEAVVGLQRVRTIHPWSDVSARVLSQAYLLRVLERAKDKPAAEQARLVGDDVTRMVDAALEAVSRGPAQPENWANAGLVYQSIAPFTRGADEFALKQFEGAWRLDPQSPRYPTELGRVYLLRADALGPMLEAKDAQTVRTAKQDEQKALAQAAVWLREALALKADYVPAHYYLAVVLDRQGKVAAAIGELEQVVAQERTADRLFELGVLYARLPDRAKAMGAFETVLRMDATQIRARWQLASLYEETGRLTEALEQLRLVAASAPTNAALQKRLQALEARVKSGKTK